MDPNEQRKKRYVFEELKDKKSAEKKRPNSNESQPSQQSEVAPGGETGQSPFIVQQSSSKRRLDLRSHNASG